MTNKRRAGMTLIELVAVVAIIAILAVIAVPRFQAITENAKVATAESNFGLIQAGILSYNTIHGTYPATFDLIIPYVENVSDGAGGVGTSATHLTNHLTKGLNDLGATITFTPSTVPATGGSVVFKLINLKNSYGTNRVGDTSVTGVYTMTYTYGN